MKVTKKLDRYLPPTKKELNEIVECYAAAFSGWKLIGGNRLERSAGPIVQQIGFEALRYKAYRPVGGIWALPLPTVAMLHQFLDVKHRQIEFRHSTTWKGVVTAMEQQFKPSIREPLDLQEIRSLCEQTAKESTNDLCMLAILSAYLGEKGKALSYCDRMQALPPPTVAPRLDWELRHKEFCRRLRGAIENEKERQFFETASVWSNNAVDE